MADVYTLAISIDASGAQTGAAQISKSTGDATKLIVELKTAVQGTQAPLDDLGKKAKVTGTGLAGLAKQFGLAKGQLKDFINLGAGVFAGDVLAKALGFGNVIGVISGATTVAAEAIVGLTGKLRDELFPEFKRNAEEAEVFKTSLESLAARIKSVQDELRGRGEFLAGPGGRKSFIPTAGLSLSDEEKVLKQVEDSTKKIQDAIKRNEAILQARRAQPSGVAGRVDPIAAEELTDISKLYVEQVASALELSGSLLRVQDIEAKRVVVLKQQNDEIERQAQLEATSLQSANEAGRAAIFRAEQRQAAERSAALGAAQRSQGIGSFLGGLGNLIPEGRDKLLELSKERNFGVKTRERFGGDFKFDENNTTPGSVLANGFKDLIGTIPTAISKMQEFDQKQREIAENAAKIRLAEDIGFTIAAGFEEAIFSGREFSDVLRQLGLDLARLIFQQTVTKQIAGIISNAIAPSGGAGDSTGGRSTASGGGGDSFNGGRSGGIGGGFRLSGRQFRESVFA